MVRRHQRARAPCRVRCCAPRSRSSAGLGSALVAVAAAPVPAGASGIVPPSNPSVNVSPQVMPRCTLTPVDDTSAGCIDSVLHNINYARSLEGLGPMVLPSDYATDPVPVQQLIIADEERGDRGLSQFSGLDPALNTAALTGAVGNADPVPPGTYHDNAWGSNFALDYTPLGADFAWMYDDGYGGTNVDCTAPGDATCWGHRDNILGPWTTTGTPDGADGRRRHERRSVHPALRQPAGPGRHRRRPRDAERTAHAVDRGRTRRGPGPARFLVRHGGRHAGDDRGQLLQHGDDAAGLLRGRGRHQRPRELGRRAQRGRAGGSGGHRNGPGRGDGLHHGRHVQLHRCGPGQRVHLRPDERTDRDVGLAGRRVRRSPRAA